MSGFSSNERPDSSLALDVVLTGIREHHSDPNACAIGADSLLTSALILDSITSKRIHASDPQGMLLCCVLPVLIRAERRR